MASFCHQCSLDTFGEDFEDFKGIITEARVKRGFSARVLCEGCGDTLVDHEGVCVAGNCHEKHGAERKRFWLEWKQIVRRFPRRRAFCGIIIWDGKVNLDMKTVHMGDDPHTATAAFTNKEGNTAPIFGIPAWSVDDPTILGLTPAADGMSCQLAVLAEGSCVVSCVAEGDTVAGADTISLQAPVTVAPEEATGGTITIS